MPREKEEVGREGGPPGCTTLHTHTHIEPNQMTFDNSFCEKSIRRLRGKVFLLNRISIFFGFLQILRIVDLFEMAGFCF